MYESLLVTERKPLCLRLFIQASNISVYTNVKLVCAKCLLDLA